MKLYETDGHCGDFTAVVLSCEATPEGRYETVLDRTAFFPEGGGQSADTGTLDGQPLLGLRTDAARTVIYHITQQPLLPGSTVRGLVDMEKRFSDMQNHTAEHIVSGTVHRLYGYDNVGFHMGSEEITMDFNGLLTAEQLTEVEMLANRAVYANLPVTISFPSPAELETIAYRSKKELEGTVRLVEIPGIDVCACCAPHVLRTGEIGLIKLLSCQKYKGGVRVSMLAGERAFRELSHRFSQVKTLSAALSAKPDTLEEAVGRLQKESDSRKAEAAAARGKYYALRASHCGAEDSVLLREEEGTFDELRAFVNLLTAQKSGICGVCVPAPGKQNDACQFVMGCKNRDMRQIAALLKESTGAKCGGSPEMIQGSAPVSADRLRELFRIISEKS